MRVQPERALQGVERIPAADGLTPTFGPRRSRGAAGTERILCRGVFSLSLRTGGPDDRPGALDGQRHSPAGRPVSPARTTRLRLDALDIQADIGHWLGPAP